VCCKNRGPLSRGKGKSPLDRGGRGKPILPDKGGEKEGEYLLLFCKRSVCRGETQKWFLTQEAKVSPS